MAPPGVICLELARDGLEAPWGFRLKGGRDVDGSTPLEVIKVREDIFLWTFFLPIDKIKKIFFSHL